MSRIILELDFSLKKYCSSHPRIRFILRFLIGSVSVNLISSDAISALLLGFSQHLLENGDLFSSAEQRTGFSYTIISTIPWLLFTFSTIGANDWIGMLNNIVDYIQHNPQKFDAPSLPINRCLKTSDDLEMTNSTFLLEFASAIMESFKSDIQPLLVYNFNGLLSSFAAYAPLNVSILEKIDLKELHPDSVSVFEEHEFKGVISVYPIISKVWPDLALPEDINRNESVSQIDHLMYYETVVDILFVFRKDHLIATSQIQKCSPSPLLQLDLIPVTIFVMFFLLTCLNIVFFSVYLHTFFSCLRHRFPSFIMEESL